MSKPKFSFRTTPLPDADHVEILLDIHQQDPAFDKKLDAFIDLEHGHQPARDWLLKDS